MVFKIDRIEKALLETASITLPENFDYAYVRLKAYNPSIDTATIIKIVATANKFAITNKLENFKWGIGQLLVESGGNHTDKDGVIISSGGAVGIGQILPSTAYGYLINRAKDIDKQILKQLGCTDISFIYNNKLTKKIKIQQAKAWLKNETNNIAMWGLIMKDNLCKHKGVMTALATYNMGPLGLKTYLDSGNTVQNNEYVLAVQQKVNLVEGRIN